MIWSPAILLLLVGATFADSQSAWKNGQEYTYKVRSRTLAAFNPQSKQYTGILMEAHLKVQPNGKNILRAKIMHPRYSQIHSHLENGWDSDIPQSKLNLQNFPLSDKPFEVKMKNGVVDDLIVDKDVPTWEVNILKSIVSQLQVDTQGENAERSKHNQFPEGEQPSALFKTMEDSVGGKCEVTYDISPMPESTVQNNPEVVPMPELRGNGDIISLVKTKNYTNCEQRVSYHQGLNGHNKWEPSSNDIRGYLSRSSVSRVVVSGNLKRYTIQSSVTINKVVLRPDQQENQQGLVASKMNLTLHQMNEVSEPVPSPENPQSTGNLVYNYNNPFESESSRRANKFQRNNRWRDSRESEEENRRNRSQRNSNENSSESSSSESAQDNDENSYYQHKPELTKPPQNPFLPFFIGNKGRSIHSSDKVDPVKEAKNIAQEIGNEIQKPDSMPEEETLEKFTILIRLIRTMDAEQIAEVLRDLYEQPQSSNQLTHENKAQNARRNAWAAARDAIAQAGTGPALVNIKRMIDDQKIQGLEAASVVVTAAKSAQIPTSEYVDTFFDLATMKETKDHPALRDAAIISFADLVRQSIVNKRSAHNRYPVHAFGKLLSNQKNRNLHEKYIPYVAEQLKKAVDNGNSKMIQLNAEALGRMAHPRILSVLEPYLEGMKPVSPYQRFIMVLALRKLTTTYPKVARSVLYKIYARSAEYDEIRTAAVFLLMKTDPPVEILQRMAENTNEDSSKQVNSAVKSAIESLAQLPDNEDSELSRAARAAMPLLTSETYGPQYSRVYYRSSKNPETHTGYWLEAKILGSDDSIIPKGLLININPTYRGLKGPQMNLGASVSSVKDLFNFVQKKLNNNQHNNNKNQKEKQQKYSPENIAKILDIQGEDPEQLEGILYGNSAYGSHLMPFDNHSLEHLPEQIKQLGEAMRKGQHIEQTKLGNYEVTMGFPTETGYPLVFTLKVPTIISVNGQFKAKLESESDSNTEIPKSASATGKARIVFGMKVQQRLGFVAPFERQQYMAGIDKNIQVDLPVRAEAEFDKSKKEVSMKIQPQEDKKETNVLEYKSEPFTSKYDIMSLKPVSRDKNTHRIQKQNTKTSEVTFNDSNNKQRLQIKWEKQSKQMGVDSPNRESKERTALKAMTKLANSISALLYPNPEVNEYERYSIQVSPSSDMSAELKMSYDSSTTERTNSDDAEEISPKVKVPHLDKSLSSHERKQRLLKQVSRDISNAKANAIDISLKLNSNARSSLDITAAMGKSNVDQKSRVLISAIAKDHEGQDYHFSAALESKNPNVESIDFEETLKSNSRRELDAEIQYGKGSGDSSSEGNSNKIKIQGKMKQSEERKNQIRHSRAAQLCHKQQTENGDKMTAACQKVNQRAASVDMGEIVITFQNESTVKRKAMEAIELIQSMSQNYIETHWNHEEKEEHNKIKIQFEVSPDGRNDFSVKTPEGKVKFSNIKLGRSSNDNYGESENNDEIESNELMISQYRTCSLDKTQATSFDGHRYPIEIGQCWHVALTSYHKKNADRPDQQEEISEEMRVSVLTRENETGQKEFKITLGEKELELSLSSDSHKPNAKVNGRSIHVSKHSSHQEKENGEVVLEVFELPDKSLKVISEKYNLRIVYDGSRAQIQAGDRFRDSVRGLCGNYDGEPSNDQQTPKGCLIQNPEEFTATYALTSESKCEGPAVQNVKKAKHAQCVFDSRQPGNVISDQEAGRSSSHRSRDSHSESERQSCMHHRTMVIRTDNHICFSLRPVPTCSSKCKATGKKQKSIQFHCVDRTSAAEKVAQRVEKGANPDLSQKTPSKTEEYLLPISCSA